jgi:uncharacterized membrane protein (GlpM family)
LFWLSLVLKMAVTAGFVIAAAMVAERAGAAIGAIVATLPIAAGPAYVFVALDHDSGFIAASAIGSITAHAATAVFSLVSVVLAQRNNMAVSVGGAVAVWFVVAFLLRQVSWSFAGAVAVNLALFGACIAVTDGYRHVRMPAIVRKWYDIPVRAIMVACLVAAVVGLSGHVGPTVTGLLAVYPIVMTSLMLIFQPRVGGPATAALIANTMWGLVGFSACLFTVHLAVVPLGTWVGLSLSLAVSVVWNIVLYWLRRRALLRRAAAATRSGCWPLSPPCPIWQSRHR